MHQPDDADKPRAIMLVAIMPREAACVCGHKCELQQDDFAHILIVTMRECPACGEPIVVSPGTPAGAGQPKY